MRRALSPSAHTCHTFLVTFLLDTFETIQCADLYMYATIEFAIHLIVMPIRSRKKRAKSSFDPKFGALLVLVYEVRMRGGLRSLR